MKKTKVIVLCLAVMGCLFLPEVLQAHVLETNEEAIGAVIHLEPNDDPFAGANTDVIFEVTDKTGAFDPAECYCMVQVVQGEQIVTSSRITGYDVSDTAKTLYSKVVFPEVGVYTVQLIGKPVTNDWFHEFTLEYEVRVMRQAKGDEELVAEGDEELEAEDNSLGVVIAIGGISLLAGVGFGLYRGKVGRQNKDVGSVTVPTFKMSDKTEKKGIAVLKAHRAGKTKEITDVDTFFKSL